MYKADVKICHKIKTKDQKKMIAPVAKRKRSFGVMKGLDVSDNAILKKLKCPI